MKALQLRHSVSTCPKKGTGGNTLKDHFVYIPQCSYHLLWLLSSGVATWQNEKNMIWVRIPASPCLNSVTSGN